MKTPKISIVLTSYNHKKYLKKAIDSILNQTFKDFELIIIDDASTDGSQLIIKEYSDSRIKCHFNNINSGSYVHSTNFGASLATSKYLLFAQCDDYAEPHQLQRLYSQIESNQAIGVVFSSSHLIDESDSLIENDYSHRSKEFQIKCQNDTLLKKTEMNEFLQKACVIPNLSAALIRTDLFREIGGLDSKYKVVADWDFWLKMSMISDFYYIREPLNNFRQHSQTIRSSIKIENQLLEILEMFYSLSNYCEIGKNIDGSYCFLEIWTTYFKNDFKDCMKSLKKIYAQANHRWYPFIPKIIKYMSSKLNNKLLNNLKT